MIKKTVNIILLAPTGTAGRFLINFGTQSLLNNKRIRSIFSKKHFGALTATTPNGEQVVTDDLFANTYLNLKNEKGEIILDMFPISAINSAIEKTGRFDQLDLENIDWAKSELVINMDTGLASQGGLKIVLNVVFE